MLVLCLLAFALRLYLLEDVSLNEDEEKSQLLYVQQSAWAILTRYDPNNHWLASVLGHLMGQLGQQHFLLRWPSLLFGALAIPLMGVAGYRLFGSRGDGLLAAWLLCLSAFHVRWSQQFRGYTALLLFALLSFLLLDQALRTGRKAAWLGLLAALALTLASHLYGVLVLIVVVVILLHWLQAQAGARAEQAPLKRWVWLICLVAFGLSGYLIWFGKIYVIDRYHPPVEASLPQLIYYQWLAFIPTLPEINNFLKGLAIGFTAHPQAELALGLFGGLALAGLVLSWSRAPHPTLFLAFWLLAPILAVILAELTIAGFFAFNRFLIFTLPAWLLLAGRGLTLGSHRLADYLRPVGRGRSVLSASLVTLSLGYLSLLNLSGLRAYFADQAGHDWRGVAAYLASRAGPTDLVICHQLLHRAPPRPDGDDPCMLALRRRLATLAATSRLPLPELAIMAADQPELPVEAWRETPGTVWVVIWGVDAALQSPAAITFDRLGHTTLLKADTGPTLAANLAQALAYLTHLEPPFSYPAHRLKTDFGHPPSIRLAGYHLPAMLRPGQMVPVTLFWQALTFTTADYTIFLHLRNATGQTVAQLDFQPFDGAYPTSAWTPGSMIEETRFWSLPADLPAGAYHLHVGLYQIDTLARLPPVQDHSGENALVLAEVRVE